MRLRPRFVERPAGRPIADHWPTVFVEEALRRAGPVDRHVPDDRYSQVWVRFEAE